MTALSVPNPSDRGCPSSLAGTTYTGDRSPISATALRSTIRCRTDRSGPFRRCVTHPRHPRLSATVPAYSRPATTSHTRTPKTAQLADNLSHRAVPRTSYRGQKAIPTTYRVSPQQLPKVQFVAERRDRRQSHSRPVGRSRPRDVSTIVPSPSQRASASLAATWLPCGCLADLHFCNSAEFRGTRPDQTLLAPLPTSPPFRPISGWKHPRLAFLQLTPIPVHPQDIKTGFLRRSRRLQTGPRPPQPAPPDRSLRCGSYVAEETL